MCDSWYFLLLIFSKYGCIKYYAYMILGGQFVGIFADLQLNNFKIGLYF